MTQAYTFLEDTAHADLAFEAEGDTPGELFEAAARALFSSMTNLRRLRPKITRQIRLRHDQIDQLMFDWLSELVYLKDAETLLFGEFSVRIQSDNGWGLEADVKGETISPKHHELRADVKAVTYHQFIVEQTPEGKWRARVVLDI